MPQKEINGWQIQPSVHPAIVALWDLFDRMPEVFGGSIDNFESARSYLDELHAGGKLESGTIDDVLSRLTKLERTHARPSIPKEILTRSEAMEYLCIADDKLFELTAPVGPIPCVRHGKRITYRIDDLREYATEQSREICA